MNQKIILIAAVAVAFFLCFIFGSGTPGTVYAEAAKLKAGPNAAAVWPAEPRDKIRIAPSHVVEDLLEIKRQNPTISAADLAVRGNELIAVQGFDFAFNTCAIAEANHRRTADLYALYDYDYQLNTPVGARVRFTLLGQYAGAMCGCVFRFPLLQLTETTMTVVTDHGAVKLVRPRGFAVDKIRLVDKALARTARTWFNHFDMPPVGISNDAKNVYFDTGYDHRNIPELLVEISEQGTVRLAPRADSNIVTDREQIKDFPKDPMNADLGYFRFKGKKGEYIVRFSWPCT